MRSSQDTEKMLQKPMPTSSQSESQESAYNKRCEVVERIYIGRRFKNDTERLEKLFELYTKMTASKGKLPKAAAQ